MVNRISLIGSIHGSDKGARSALQDFVNGNKDAYEHFRKKDYINSNGKVERIEAGYAAEKKAFGNVLTKEDCVKLFNRYVK